MAHTPGPLDPANLPQKSYKLMWELTPVPCVDLVIVDDDKFLLSKRNIPPSKGLWHLPGGRIHKGELAIEAAKRKAFEETGLQIDVKKFIGYYDDPNTDARGHAIVLGFVCEPIGGTLQKNKDASGLKYFNKIPQKLGFRHQAQVLRDAEFQ